MHNEQERYKEQPTTVTPTTKRINDHEVISSIAPQTTNPKALKSRALTPLNLPPKSGSLGQDTIHFFLLAILGHPRSSSVGLGPCLFILFGFSVSGTITHKFRVWASGLRSPGFWALLLNFAVGLPLRV